MKLEHGTKIYKLNLDTGDLSIHIVGLNTIDDDTFGYYNLTSLCGNYSSRFKFPIQDDIYLSVDKLYATNLFDLVIGINKIFIGEFPNRTITSGQSMFLISNVIKEIN